MSINPLNDISKVYLEQISESSHLETDMKKRGEENEKAIEDMKKTKAHKDMVAAARKKFDEALDPVGKEDSDIDNDGDSDKSDKYLHNRRKAIGKAIANNRRKSVKEGFSNWRQDLSEVMDDDVDNKPIKEKKVNNKIKTSALSGGLKLGEAMEEIGGTLLEMVEIDEVDFVVESVYGELLEEGYEEDDIEEAIEFALTEAKVTFGHDTPTGQKKKGNLVAAVGRLARQKLSSKVRGAKKAAGEAVARGARNVARKMEGGDTKPSPAQTKTRSASTYRGAGAGTKERVSSGSYTPPTKKKAEKPADPWEGSATTPTKSKPKAATKKAAAPKAKAPAAAPKRKRKSKLDSLLADIRSEQVQIDEKITAKTDMGAAIKDFYASKSPQLAGRTKEQRRKAAIAAVLTARRGGRKLGEQAMEIQPKSQQSGQQDQAQKKAAQQRDRERQQEVQILQRKLQALRSAPKGSDPNITA